MRISVASSVEAFSEDFSTQVYPPLEPLIEVIRVLRDGFVDERVKLLIGEPECEFAFRADEGRTEASLRIEIWPDHRRNKFFTPKIAFSIHGAREELVAPFVTAFKNLRASVNDIDFEREYGSTFPITQYKLLAGDA